MTKLSKSLPQHHCSNILYAVPKEERPLALFLFGADSHDQKAIKVLGAILLAIGQHVI